MLCFSSHFNFFPKRTTIPSFRLSNFTLTLSSKSFLIEMPGASRYTESISGCIGENRRVSFPITLPSLGTKRTSRLILVKSQLCSRYLPSTSVSLTKAESIEALEKLQKRKLRTSVEIILFITLKILPNIVTVMSFEIKTGANISGATVFNKGD